MFSISDKKKECDIVCLHLFIHPGSTIFAQPEYNVDFFYFNSIFRSTFNILVQF